MHTFTAYLKKSKIKEQANITDGNKILKILVQDYKELIIAERQILKLAEKNGDEGTSTLLTDYITQQEKTVWMLNAALG